MQVAAGPHTLAAAIVVRTRRRPAPTASSTSQARTPGISQVTIAGPFNPTGPGDTPSRRRLLVCTPAAAGRRDCVRAARSSTRSPRAPIGGRSRVERPEMDTLLEFYRAGPRERHVRVRHPARGGARARRSAVPLPLRARTGERRARRGVPLSDLELASRLSFFLWSSIPDDELLAGGARKRHAEGPGRRSSGRCGGCSRIRAPTRSSPTSPAQWLLLRELKNARPGFAGVRRQPAAVVPA